MEDFSLDRFGELLQNLKAQKAEDSEEGDERAIAFNEGARGGNAQGMMNNMMWSRSDLDHIHYSSQFVCSTRLQFLANPPGAYLKSSGRS